MLVKIFLETMREKKIIVLEIKACSRVGQGLGLKYFFLVSDCSTPQFNGYVRFTEFALEHVAWEDGCELTPFSRRTRPERGDWAPYG